MFTKSSQKSKSKGFIKWTYILFHQSINIIMLIIQGIACTDSLEFLIEYILFNSCNNCSQNLYGVSILYLGFYFSKISLFHSLTVYFYLNCMLAKLSIIIHQFRSLQKFHNVPCSAENETRSMLMIWQSGDRLSSLFNIGLAMYSSNDESFQILWMKYTSFKTSSHLPLT